MINLPRTKIVCTVGPATEDDDVLREMIRAGMDVARLNFSHGDHEYHRRNIERVRSIAAELDATVAIMVDTKGPEIRTRLNEDHKPIVLDNNEHVIVTAEAPKSSPGVIAIDYTSLAQEVTPGTVIYLDDGLISLKVKRVEGAEIHCTVSNSGVVGERKGVNVPNVVMQLPAVTERDKEDIRFACEMKADAIAASFIRDADAVREIRELCHTYGHDEMLVISKMESSLALTCFDEILEESDGIMVARGDLSVEIPPAKVPHVQKEIIEKCNECYKPVITATQMLESMTHNPRPTRAEVTDVANAILDGTDCVMLSGETAAGAYPAEAVRMMAEICRQAERYLPPRYEYHDRGGLNNVSGAASFGAIEMAERIGAAAIFCPTKSGRTARIMSAFRPNLPIYAASSSDVTIRRTCFYWGVTGILATEQDGLAAICYDTLKTARHYGLVKQDDLVVITAGDPVTSPLTSHSETSTNVCMIAQIF